MNQTESKMILIFVRHGERLDQVESLGKKIIYPECDPPLTDNGKKMASDSALLTRDYLIQKGYSDAKVKVISSPFIRTLQTAAYFQNSLGFNNNKKIFTNNNICVILNGTTQSFFQKGLYSTVDSKKILKEWCDMKSDYIEQDKLQIKLFETNGSYKEKSSKERYQKGFEDIIQKHFVKQKNSPQQQIVVLVSHSDGINTFLRHLGYSDQKINDPGYCCTIAVELEKNNDTSYKVINLDIIKK